MTFQEWWEKSGKEIDPEDGEEMKEFGKRMAYLAWRGSFEDVASGMSDARKIIEKVGTTGIEHANEQADRWLKKWFPEWL